MKYLSFINIQRRQTSSPPPPLAKPHPLVCSTPKRLKHVPVGGDRHSYTYRLRRFWPQPACSSDRRRRSSPPASTGGSPSTSADRPGRNRAPPGSLLQRPSPRCPTGSWARRRSCSRRWGRSACSPAVGSTLRAARWTTPQTHWPTGAVHRVLRGESEGWGTSARACCGLTRGITTHADRSVPDRKIPVPSTNWLIWIVFALK